MEIQPNAQCSFHKVHVDNSCHKKRKFRYSVSEVLFNYTVYLSYMKNIFDRIV